VRDERVISNRRVGQRNVYDDDSNDCDCRGQERQRQRQSCLLEAFVALGINSPPPPLSDGGEGKG